jgi:hypothetical protein
MKAIIWNSSSGIRNYNAGNSLCVRKIFEIDLTTNNNKYIIIQFLTFFRVLPISCFIIVVPIVFFLLNCRVSLSLTGIKSIIKHEVFPSMYILKSIHLLLLYFYFYFTLIKNFKDFQNSHTYSCRYYIFIIAFWIFLLELGF